METDEVHSWALEWELVYAVAKPLSIMFDKLWQSDEGPTDWKRRKITPIFKKGNTKTQGTTGQSVSLLSLARSWTRSS